MAANASFQVQRSFRVPFEYDNSFGVTIRREISVTESTTFEKLSQRIAEELDVPGPLTLTYPDIGPDKTLLGTIHPRDGQAVSDIIKSGRAALLIHVEDIRWPKSEHEDPEFTIADGPGAEGGYADPAQVVDGVVSEAKATGGGMTEDGTMTGGSARGGSGRGLFGRGGDAVGGGARSIQGKAARGGSARGGSFVFKG